MNELDNAMVTGNKDLVELTERKVTQESKYRRLKAKAEMYELLKQKSQSAINLVGIFHPVFRAKTKVMITSAEVQATHYQKQAEIAKGELELVAKQLEQLKSGMTLKEVLNKKRAVQGAKVLVKGGVINFSNPKNARLLQGLFDVKGEPTANLKRLTQLCVDYPKSVATMPKNVLRDIKAYASEMLLTIEIYKIFGKRPKQEPQSLKQVLDARQEKIKKLEDTSGLAQNNEKIKEEEKQKNAVQQPESNNNSNQAVHQQNPIDESSDFIQSLIGKPKSQADGGQDKINNITDVN